MEKTAEEGGNTSGMSSGGLGKLILIAVVAGAALGVLFFGVFVGV